MPGTPCSPWWPMGPGCPGIPGTPAVPLGPWTPFGPSSPLFPACNEKRKQQQKYHLEDTVHSLLMGISEAFLQVSLAAYGSYIVRVVLQI